MLAVGPVADADPDPATLGSYPEQFVRFGDAVYFFARAADSSVGLWRTDGTPDGTTLVKGGLAGGDSPATGLTAALGRLWFSNWDPVHGREPWTSDGTPAGTSMLKDLRGPGTTFAGSSDPTEFTEFDGRAFFSARGPFGFPQLWASDGTPEGTHLFGASDPQELTVSGGLLYFFASDSLWRTDGSEKGTQRLAAGFSNDRLKRSHQLVDVGGTLFFAGHAVGTGNELWRSNGTPETTVLVRDIVPGELSSRPWDLVNVGGSLFSVATNPASRRRGVWKSDGTAEGTVLLAESGSEGLFPNQLGEANGSLVFGMWRPETGFELWRSDGTVSGTALLADIEPGPGSGLMESYFPNSGRERFFVARDAAAGPEVWRTDGTPGGTARFTDVNPGPAPGVPIIGGVVAGGTPPWGALLGNRLIFSGSDAATQAEPWVSDGTPGGTYRLKDINIRPLVAGEILGRRVFYNESAYDRPEGGSSGAGAAADAAAVAPDKSALLPDQAATFANVTSYVRGINGVMIDLWAPSRGESVQTADFVFRTGPAATGSGWTAAPGPASFSFRRGAGVNGSDRVTVTWGENAVKNAWLQVTMLATASTGLARPDVFCFGNAVGDTGEGNAPDVAAQVNALDLAAVKRALNTASVLDGPFDFDRDGRVNALDLAAVKRNLSRQLPAVPAGPAAPVATPVAAPVAASALPPLDGRRIWDEAMSDPLVRGD